MPASASGNALSWSVAQPRWSCVALLEAGLEQALLRRDIVGAAERVERIVALQHPDDPAARFAKLRARQDALYVEGRDKEIVLPLEVSIEVARRTLAVARDAQERGAALNDLGVFLQTLGERESGTARLEEAVAAYRAALEERTRERVPLDWAATQNNLGIALCDPRRARERHGAAGGGGRRLSRGAGGMDPRARAARLGDDAEQSRQCALRRLGERESGTARLEEAVAAYRAALEEWTRERVPLDWAHDAEQSRQCALGPSASARAARRGWRRRSPPIARRWRNAPASACRSTGRRRRTISAMRSATLGERESGTARLEEAVAAYRAALEERTRERVPLDWATTQNNLGNALLTPRRARERHGAAGGGGRRLSRGAGGTHPRARAARLGDDAEQSRQRARDARRARERHGAAGGGGRRLIVRRWRSAPASACRSIWAMTTCESRAALGRAGEGARSPCPPAATAAKPCSASAQRRGRHRRGRSSAATIVGLDEERLVALLEASGLSRVAEQSGLDGRRTRRRARPAPESPTVLDLRAGPDGAGTGRWLSPST